MATATKAAQRDTRVLIIDDHPLFRSGVVLVLEAEGLRVVGDASTYEETLNMAEMAPIDLAIVDILMPHRNGVAVTRTLREQFPDLRILGLSVIDDPTRIVELLRSGADSFAHKSQPIPEIMDAVRTTIAGETYLWPAMREEIEQLLRSDHRPPLELLTEREREVFELLVRGSSNQRAALSLGIAVRTVETHRHRIMRKLGAHSVADLVRFAARWGALA